MQLAGYFLVQSIDEMNRTNLRRVYTTEEKWHGSDKKWNGSIHFCKETVNFRRFRYGTIGAFGERPRTGSPQSPAPTFTRPVCGKSFGSSSFEQERLLRRLERSDFLICNHSNSDMFTCSLGLSLVFI